MRKSPHNLIEPDPLYVDHHGPGMSTNRRSPRASEFRRKLAELDRERAHSAFLVTISALAILALAWWSTSLRDELTDAQAQLVVLSTTLAAKTVAERQWNCTEPRAYKAAVKTCIRTVSRM